MTPTASVRPSNIPAPQTVVICFSANSFKCSYIGSKRTREFAAGPVQPSSSTVSGCIKDDRATNAIIITRCNSSPFPTDSTLFSHDTDSESTHLSTHPVHRQSPLHLHPLAEALDRPQQLLLGTLHPAVTASTRRRRPPSSSSWSTTTRRNTKPFPSSSPNISPFSAAASSSTSMFSS